MKENEASDYEKEKAMNDLQREAFITKTLAELTVDLRKYDLCDELGVDLISIEDLLSKLEDRLYEIKELKDKIKELETPEEEPDDYEERLIRGC